MLRECVTLPGLHYSLLTIPKVAATAMRRALLRGNGIELEKGQVHRHSRLVKLTTAEALARGPVYAFVRHPLDRLVSCWADRIAGASPSVPMMELGYTPGASFAAFVDQVRQIGPERNPHTARQTAFVEDGVWWYRYEQLSAMWPCIQRTTGLPPLERTNQSERGNWRGYYDDQSLNTAFDLYRSDFEAFGYAG